MADVEAEDDGAEEGEEQEEDDGEDDDDELVQAQGETADAPVTILKSPHCPSWEERVRHNATHLLYRNWCPICIRARGREDDHKRVKKKREGASVVVMDYKSFGHDIDDDMLTALVARDKGSGMMAANICE